MKIKGNFILRQIAGSWTAIRIVKDSAETRGVMSLNDTGALLWKELEQGCDMDHLADVLVREYGLDAAQAKADASDFVEKLRMLDCIV